MFREDAGVMAEHRELCTAAGKEVCVWCGVVCL